jgi:hypothetical protein
VSGVLVVSFTDFASDPRVDRQIRILRTRHEILAAGLGPPRYDVNEFITLSTPPRTKLGRVLGLIQLLARRYEAVYWNHPTNVAALDRLRHVRADVVVANDIETLPIALRLGSPVVFDAHEYAPAQFADLRWWRALISPYVRWQCRRYIPQVSAMTTASYGFADEYERETGVRATVVSNAPPRADLQPTPVHDPVRILHHGVANRGRGLAEMIRLAELLDERFTVDLVLARGVPGYRDELIRRARGNPRVRFPEPQPMHTLAKMANDYDIGVSLLPPVNFSHFHALPNKFFEYVQGRLAVAIGPSPEMARLMHQYGCGIVADDFAPETLAAALNALDASTIATFKSASHAAANELCAENNEELVLSAVEDALARSAAARAPAPR